MCNLPSANLALHHFPKWQPDKCRNGENSPKVPSQGEHADALGVRGSGSHKRFEEGVVNTTATPSQGEHTDALGVRNRGKTWDSRTQENNVVNTTIIPSQEDHADALGVREQHKSKENFGKWISRNFPNLREVVSLLRQKKGNLRINVVMVSGSVTTSQTCY